MGARSCEVSEIARPTDKGDGAGLRQGDGESRRRQVLTGDMPCLLVSPISLSRHVYDVIPLVSAMKAVSRLISSSLSSVSLWPAATSARGQVAVVVLAVGERDVEVLGVLFHAVDQRVLFEQLGRGVRGRRRRRC